MTEDILDRATKRGRNWLFEPKDGDGNPIDVWWKWDAKKRVVRKIGHDAEGLREWEARFQGGQPWYTNHFAVGTDDVLRTEEFHAGHIRTIRFPVSGDITTFVRNAEGQATLCRTTVHEAHQVVTECSADDDPRRVRHVYVRTEEGAMVHEGARHQVVDADGSIAVELVDPGVPGGVGLAHKKNLAGVISEVRILAAIVGAPTNPELDELIQAGLDRGVASLLAACEHDEVAIRNRVEKALNGAEAEAAAVHLLGARSLNEALVAFVFRRLRDGDTRDKVQLARALAPVQAKLRSRAVEVPKDEAQTLLALANEAQALDKLGSLSSDEVKAAQAAVLGIAGIDNTAECRHYVYVEGVDERFVPLWKPGASDETALLFEDGPCGPGVPIDLDASIFGVDFDALSSAHESAAKALDARGVRNPDDEDELLFTGRAVREVVASTGANLAEHAETLEESFTAFLCLGNASAGILANHFDPAAASHAVADEARSTAVAALSSETTRAIACTFFAKEGTGYLFQGADGGTLEPLEALGLRPIAIWETSGGSYAFGLFAPA